jgi:Carboxypeptidase regulatory-like domain
MIRPTRVLALAVLAATCPTTSAAQVAIRARVTGSVYDSVAMRPLSEATVRIVRADDPSVGYSATTGITGSFEYASVPAGTWLATFLHPVLDSMRLEAAIVRIIITEAGTIQVPLATPSLRTVMARTCRGALAADLGMMSGEVRRAGDDVPLAGASVFVEWPEWVLQRGRLVTDWRRLVARTDSSGRYALCGVPSNNALKSFAWSGADTTGAIEVPVPSTGYALQDFTIAPVDMIAVRVDSTVTGVSAPPRRTVADSAATVTVRRGRAAVRGIVRTLDGRPIANAVVRVIGSGSQVRSTAAGAFSIADAGAGTQTVEARAIGYQPTRIPVSLRDGEPTSVIMRLSIQRVQLDTVRVVAGRQIAPEVRAIERRWQSGVGTVLDAKTVREKATLFVSDALRGINGVSVTQIGGFGQAVMMRSSFNGAECLANIFVDGQLIPKSAGNVTLDDLARKEDVAAIEIYPRSNLIPAEFTNLSSGCGVVALWTRRATGGVAPLNPRQQAAKP